ncbi:MAG: hypothetical protein LYZ69_01375 [Nitrososphaerales archaeon]|nr:hypothetical protein [Nitrososphaerales archaeon]
MAKLALGAFYIVSVSMVMASVVVLAWTLILADTHGYSVIIYDNLQGEAAIEMVLLLVSILYVPILFRDGVKRAFELFRPSGEQET